MLREFLCRLLFDHYVEAYNTYDLRDKARVGARLHAAKIQIGRAHV